MTFSEIQGRLLNMEFPMRDGSMISLRDPIGRSKVSITLLKKIINEALSDWAIESMLDKDVWVPDDGTGSPGTLTAEQRRYAFPIDMLVIFDAFVAYDDANNFEGYPVRPVISPFNSDLLENGSQIVIQKAVEGYEYQNHEVTFSASTLTINYSDLPADVNGNQPPAQFTETVILKNLKAWGDKNIYPIEVTKNYMTLGLGQFGSGSATFGISFILSEQNIATLGSENASACGIPKTAFIWQNEITLDPAPAENYTFRMYGYKKPAALSDDTDEPEVLNSYKSSLFKRCKAAVAEELNSTIADELAFKARESIVLAKEIDARRHRADIVIESNNPLWR